MDKFALDYRDMSRAKSTFAEALSNKDLNYPDFVFRAAGARRIGTIEGHNLINFDELRLARLETKPAAEIVNSKKHLQNPFVPSS